MLLGTLASIFLPPWLIIISSPHYDKAKIAYNKGEKDKAWEHFKLAVSEYGANRTYYAAVTEEDDEKAMKLYRKAAEKNLTKGI